MADARSPGRPGRRPRRPTLDERDAFILKLIEFRRELPPRQQRMLDAMAVAAFCERPAEVQGYARWSLADLPCGRDDTPWMAAYARAVGD